MKVLLINPPQTQPKQSVKRCIVPMGLAYIASYLEERKHIVKIIDCIVEGYDTEIIHEDGQMTFGLKESDVKLMVLSFNPDFVGVSAMMSSEAHNTFNVCRWVKEVNKDIQVIVGGAHASVMGKLLLENKDIDHVVIGEGEESMLRIVEGNTKGVVSSPLIDLKTLPLPARHLLKMEKYISIDMPTSVFGKKNRTTQVETSRGCPFSCLSGDTLINTIEGDIPIKDLIDRDKIGVYTYDRKTKEVFITDAINIQKTGINKELVRVRFDDNTYIDCTPDHKFLTFKNGNQFGNTRETIKEAKYLISNESVRAIKFNKHTSYGGYVEVQWGRRSRKKRSRLIMEYLLNKKLNTKEQIHHKNMNPEDDSPENLLYCENAKIHLMNHYPEIFKRMKENNPNTSNTEETKIKIGLGNQGKIRTKEQIINYKNSKLADKNPNWKKTDDNKIAKLYSEGFSMYKIGEIFNCSHATIGRRLQSLGIEARGYKLQEKQINHKIIKIEYLKERQDVYNLEVPSTHWFFANYVLVHNCNFCCTTNFWGRKWRTREVNDIIDELIILKNDYNIKEIDFTDSNMVVNKKRTIELCKAMVPLRLSWANPGGMWADGLDEEVLYWMKKSGCYQVTFAVENANEHILKDIIHKPIHLEKVKPLVKYCHKIGIDTHAFFVMGFPEESVESMIKTYDYALDANFTSATFNIVQPLPGSALWEQHKSHIKDFTKINLRYSTIDHPEIGKEALEEMVDGFNTKFNSSAWYRNPKMFILKYMRVAFKRHDIKFIMRMFKRQ